MGVFSDSQAKRLAVRKELERLMEENKSASARLTKMLRCASETAKEALDKTLPQEKESA